MVENLIKKTAVLYKKMEFSEQWRYTQRKE